MNFGENLQKIRKEHHLSQEELANKLNVSRQAVSKWESNMTYPEMDKIIAMAQIFECSIDELVNGTTKEIKTENNSNKKNFDDYKNDVVEFLRKSVIMFSNMSFHEIVKLIIVMLLVVLILCIGRIPIVYIEDMGSNFLGTLPEVVGNSLSSVLILILDLAYFIIAAIAFVYIYKIKFLDNFKVVTKVKNNNENKAEAEQNTIEEIEKNIKEEVEQKTISKKDSSFGILDVLAKIITYFIKFLAIMFAIPFIFTLIGSCVALALSIILLFNKVVFIGIILGIIAVICLNVSFLEILFNFIFNVKWHAKRLFIQIISALVLLGVGIGITSVDIASFEYINKAPEAKIVSKNYEFDMQNDLFIRHYYYYNDRDIKFVEDESVTNVKIELKYAPKYAKFKIEQYCANLECLDVVSDGPDSLAFNSVMNIIIKDLQNKEIHNYNELSQAEVIVTTNKENIKKMQENFANYALEEEQREYDYSISELENEIEALETEKERLEEKVWQLEEQNDELKETYEEKINEYKEKIQNYKDSINELE